MHFDWIQADIHIIKTGRRGRTKRQTRGRNLRSEWICEWESEWMNQWVSEWTNKWTTQWAIHSFIHSFTHLLIHSFTHSLVHSFTRSFIHSFIHSSIHSFIHDCVIYWSGTCNAFEQCFTDSIRRCVRRIEILKYICGHRPQEPLIRIVNHVPVYDYAFPHVRFKCPRCISNKRTAIRDKWAYKRTHTHTHTHTSTYIHTLADTAQTLRHTRSSFIYNILCVCRSVCLYLSP